MKCRKVNSTDPVRSAMKKGQHFSDEVNSLSYLPWIKYFGLQVSVTWLVYRNINDKESSLGISHKGICISSVSWE